MPCYRVEYRIDIECDTPEEAAQIAQSHCLDPAWGSRVWTVTDEDGEERNVYLDHAGAVV